jgi:hypothetical protein
MIVMYQHETWGVSFTPCLAVEESDANENGTGLNEISKSRLLANEECSDVQVLLDNVDSCLGYPVVIIDGFLVVKGECLRGEETAQTNGNAIPKSKRRHPF